ncbi:MAG: transketolase [Clostridia bacterium]
MRISPKLTSDRSQYLREIALQLRCDVIECLTRAGSGHPGGSLSSADIVATLFFDVMKLDPLDPAMIDRDRFILAKGHAAPLLYAALANLGYFPREELLTLRHLGSRLQGHPDMLKTPGVEASTGSLGQGLSIAVGLALGATMDEADWGVYALLGDGEMQEGQVWEAAMAAAHYGLGNLVAVIDNNGLQIDGRIVDVMSPEPVADKWRAFGWEVFEIDGHDFGQIHETLRVAQKSDRPAVIIAHTTKGKGVDFMEGDGSWHGKAPSDEQCSLALEQLRRLKPHE